MRLGEKLALGYAYGSSLLAYMIDGAPRPFSATWAVTNRCNLRCSYCNCPFIDPSHLDLTRVVRAAAAEIRFGCVEVHSPGVSGQLINSADWMVLTRNPALVAELALVEYKPAEPPKKPVLWTDARSSLFEIVR